jgi:hypothetical protein
MRGRSNVGNKRHAKTTQSARAKTTVVGGFLEKWVADAEAVLAAGNTNLKASFALETRAINRIFGRLDAARSQLNSQYSELSSPEPFDYTVCDITGWTHEQLEVSTPSQQFPGGVFSVEPALPAGVSLAASHGVISGSPESNCDHGNYVVSFFETAGAEPVAQAKVTLAVTTREPPLSIQYHESNALYTQHISVMNSPTTQSGGRPAMFTIAPDLPDGLIFNVLTGTVSGSAKTPLDETAFTVTASNSAGKCETCISIKVAGSQTAATEPATAQQKAEGSSDQSPVHTPGLTGAVEAQWSGGKKRGKRGKGGGRSVKPTPIVAPTPAAPESQDPIASADDGAPAHENLIVNFCAPPSGEQLERATCITCTGKITREVVEHSGISLLEDCPKLVELVIAGSLGGDVSMVLDMKVHSMTHFIA